MNLAKLNSFNTKTTRQVILGLGLGLIGIFVLSFILSISNKSTNSLHLDSEIITISETISEHIKKDKTADSNIKISDAHQIKADGFKFFSINKAPLTDHQLEAIKNGSPRLSIVISDVGQNRSIIKQIIEKLPKNITISLSSHHKNQNEIAAELNKYGFEIWQDVIALTETMHSDKGTFAITPTNDFNRNTDLLDKQISDKHFITGLVLPAGALITKTPPLWESLVQDLFSQGYGVFDNTESLVKPSLYFSNDKRAPYIKGDIIIDNTMTNELIDEKLSSLVKTVQNETTLIVTIKSPTPSTLDKLVKWLDSLDSKITLVPLSAHAKL